MGGALQRIADLDVVTLVTAGATFGLVLSLWSIFVLSWARRKWGQRMELRRRLEGEAAAFDARTLRLWHDGREETTIVPGQLAQPTLGERMEQLRVDAGWQAPLGAILLSVFVASLGLAIAVFVMSGRVVPAAVTAFAVWAIFWVTTTRRIAKRERVFERQLVDALELSARALRAGHPLLGAFQLIADEIPAPVGRLFGDIVQQQSMGVRLDEALRRSAVLTRSPDMKLFAASLAINLRTGGNLADVMQGLAYVIRERLRLSRRFRVLIAQTQISKRILIAMPFAMFGVLHMISPEYMGILYTTRMGNLLLLIAGVGLLMGWMVMNRMAQLKA